ncbi:MAG: YeeE/YedE family protein [Nisaea sp.]|uniref:YeeE/YedE thiosulfate transporter family protein n=1 Tax=Nisaea sp. TaxID=2024842 RepID=UPI001B05880C|nr:YeeE/YedE thiosulfate transporter family protein [Nisaea sp.]MBO6560234.1 YeeE/YedE family protein [Nisaea sp.]
MRAPLTWKAGGLLLGAVFFAAVLLVKPIGVSTQFVIFDGILWDAVSPSVVTESTEAKSGYTSTNAYLAKSGGKYAKNVENPLNYSFVFVLALIGGAALSARLRGGVEKAEKTMPAVWRANFGDEPWKRYVAAFLAGFVVLYGARMAGGCTSGHMMSGMMQTAVSGFIFAAGAFAAGIPTALVLFRKES